VPPVRENESRAIRVEKIAGSKEKNVSWKGASMSRRKRLRLKKVVGTGWNSHPPWYCQTLALGKKIEDA